MRDFLAEANLRTDLAVEAHEMIAQKGPGKREIPGLSLNVENDQEIKITRVGIHSPEAEQAMGKPQGNYVTIESPGLRYKNTSLQQEAMRVLAKEISAMSKLPATATVLIVGLGNWNVTPDALGPKTVEKVVITRHLKSMLSPELRANVRSVCAVAPGVLGITGIETVEIVSGIVNKLRPDLVIAIDALAASSSYRVITTIQLADTGISPGSGVGNKRFGLSQASLGVPVLAIGVPTVVHASTIAVDTISILQQQAAFARYFRSLADLSEQERQTIISQVLPETLGDLMVTPKEVDRLIDDIADILAGGINQSMHPQIDYSNIHMYLH